MSCNYMMTLAYDGTDYKGYQMQAGKHAAPTVQHELESCLMRILQIDREALRLQGAGRTDAGVHARGQVSSIRVWQVLSTLGVCAGNLLKHPTLPRSPTSSATRAMLLTSCTIP